MPENHQKMRRSIECSNRRGNEVDELSQFNDSTRAALNVEEAALLPALPRNRGAGSAALRAALQAAQAIGERKVSNPVNLQIPTETSAAEQTNPTYRRANSRAALHHILRR